MSALTKILKDVSYRTAMMYVLGYTYKKDEEFSVDDFEKIMKAHYPEAMDAYDSGGTRFGVFIQQMKNELYLIPLEKGYGVKRYRFSGFSEKNIQHFAKANLDMELLRPRHANIIPDKDVLKALVPQIKTVVEDKPDAVQELKTRLADLSAIVEKITMPNEAANKIAERFPFLLTMPEEKISKLEQICMLI
jgi:hypothetical protein